MGFILGFLGACIGVIAGIFIIVMIIYAKVMGTVGHANMKELIKAAKNARNVEMQEYAREKNVSGITRLIEPTIIEDFGDFNKEYLYSKVEQNLRKIFNCIEDKNISNVQNDNDLIYILPSLREKIADLRGNNVNVRYDDVKFHAHAIKNYMKTQGKATIIISSTVEYYYRNDSTKKDKFADIKKQTRYTTEFVYIYDETKFRANVRALTISCPNCGAPLTKLGAGNCSYCGTYIKPINLKGWYMVSYKEDYK